MFAYIWPISLVVLSNVIYHICTKSAPENLNPFFSLVITYLIAAVFATVLFFLTDARHDILKEVSKLNWTSVVLGVVIVGLEAGFLFAYKAGWQVSTASVVQSSFLAIALIVIGALFFQEKVTWNKLVGIGICMVGLIFINMK